MRVALFSNGFPEKPDGNYTPAVIDTLLRLSESHEIWVFALGGMQPAEEKSYRFHRLHVVATGPLAAVQLPWKALKLLRDALRLHREEPFHLAHGLWHVGGLLATIFGKLAKCRVLLSMLGGEVVRVPAHDYGVIAKPHWQWILRRCLAQADAITTGSKYYYSKVAEFAPAAKARIVLAPLGVDSAAIPLRNQEPNAEWRLLNVAALQTVKNIPQVLQTVGQLQSRSWHLTIAGIGPLETELRGEIVRRGLENHVYLAGWQPERLFKQQIRRYDLLISLSTHEAQGMAMIEAAAAGLPILATRVGVADELAALGAAIVFVDSTQTAFAALQYCLQNLQALQQQARTATAKVRAQYDLSHTIRRFEDLYAQPGSTACWYQSPMPLSMKLRRKIRPLFFRLALPILQQQLKKNVETEIDGIKLRTKSEVFHPNYFFSSKIIGRYMAARIVKNQKLLDMGTGSGVIGIMAAKRGAEVLAIDVNPAAVALANENASLHGLNGCWRCMESDLFARLEAKEKFDWIAFNPPYFSGPVQRPAEAAWYAGENYETIDCFLAQAKNFLNEGGKIVLIVSSDMPLAWLHEKFQQHRYHLVAHRNRPHLFEIFYLVELQARDGL